MIGHELKEKAVDFGSWMLKKGIKPTKGNNGWIYMGKVYSTDKMYDKFIHDEYLENAANYQPFNE